ncbi:MAG: hypothetical protein KAR40_15330 [Candidatus Sabulitectum sp.]|nr:hypothetical protein [Candidatus Sabulitectum sp.]
MTTAVKIINFGLSKLGASRVSTIAPPKTNLERYMADNYSQWRDEELAANRWHFAMEYVQLTLTGDPVTGAGSAKPNRYQMPNDAIRPIREKGQDWERRGRYLYSAYEELTVKFILRVSEDVYDPMFVAVLSHKVAKESVEYVTQSNSKEVARVQGYNEAIKKALKVNAFLKGSESVAGENDQAPGEDPYSWVTSRG